MNFRVHKDPATGSLYGSLPNSPNALQRRIAELVVEHGSLRAVGRALGADVSYLSRLQAGSKVAPSKTLLARMGLRAVVTYERIPA